MDLNRRSLRLRSCCSFKSTFFDPNILFKASMRIVGVSAVHALLLGETTCFSVGSVTRIGPLVCSKFASNGDELTEAETYVGNISKPSSWIELLDPALRSDMERELVAKYMQAGLAAEEAQKQTSIFLCDSEQAEKYFEMRMYAEANTQSLPITMLQLIGGFLAGFAAIAGPKLINH